MSVWRVSRLVLAILVGVAVGCGGGGGRPGDFFAVGGTIVKPDGQEVVLQLNGGQDLHLTAAGGFRFANGVMNGQLYAVSVASAPAGQTCTVSRGSGTMAGGPVSDVEVTCSTQAHTVGGTVSDLAGTVVLNLNGELLTVTGSAFTFRDPVAFGAKYEVSVATQPSTQNCTIQNAAGTMGAADVADVAVTCTSTPPKPTLHVTAGVKQLQFAWTAARLATSYQLYEAADGATYAKVGEAVTGTSAARELSVHRFAWTTAKYRVEACNASGCVSSDAIGVADQMIAAIGYFKASNPGDEDQLGSSVVLSADGSTLAVGAPYESSAAKGVNGDQTDDSASKAGAVYVFTRSGGTWSQQAYLKASNTGADDNFGASLALSADGSTLAVGAPYESSDAKGVNGDQTNDAAEEAGAVYVFTRTGTTWSQQAYVKASNTDAWDFFGTSVALTADGSTLAVGGYREDSSATGIDGDQSDNSLLEAGAVYVFTRTGSTWTQQAYVKASNTGLYDYFGLAVALSSDGSTLAVGATCETSSATGVGGNQQNNSLGCAGAVYVYTRSGAQWSQQAYLKASDTHAEGRFGSALALSADGSTLAVGEESADAAVSVFLRAGTTWSQQARLTAFDVDRNDYFSRHSVALSADGSTLAVGAFGESGAATGVGGTAAEDPAFNWAGAVYLFTRGGSTWSQQVYVKAPNTGGGDTFGSSVALSGDASTLAVGAPGEASDASGVGGDQTRNSGRFVGAVYLY